MSEPSSRPMKITGRKAAISRALTHGPGRLGGWQAVGFEDPAQSLAPFGVDAPSALELGVVADAGERGRLRLAVEVEGAAHLAERGHDLGRAHAVADAQTGEPVDLRE